MSEGAKMWEALQCLPSAVQNLHYGDPEDDESVTASDAVEWAIKEIVRLRDERRAIAVVERLLTEPVPAKEPTP